MSTIEKLKLIEAANKRNDARCAQMGEKETIQWFAIQVGSDASLDDGSSDYDEAVCIAEKWASWNPGSEVRLLSCELSVDSITNVEITQKGWKV